jgi:hypothetical protein
MIEHFSALLFTRNASGRKRASLEETVRQAAKDIALLTKVLRRRSAAQLQIGSNYEMNAVT